MKFCCSFLCGGIISLSLLSSGQGLKQQTLFDVGVTRQAHTNDNEAVANTAQAARLANQDANDIAPNNNVIDLVSSNDEVEVENLPRNVQNSHHGVEVDPRMLADPHGNDSLNNDVIDLLSSDDEDETLPPAPHVETLPRVPRPCGVEMEDGRNVRPREGDTNQAGRWWNILRYIGEMSVSHLPTFLLNAGANDVIRPMLQDCLAFQRLQQLTFHKEGGIPRNLFSPDGWMPHLNSAKVIAILNFVGDTRLIMGQRHVIGNGDGTFREPCLETVIKIFASVFAIFGVHFDVARIISRCIIVFANRMAFGKCYCCFSLSPFATSSHSHFLHFLSPQPQDGRYDWHSRARKSFNDVARVTDPLQRSVIQHVLRNCANITHAIIFGRPSFDKLGDGSWWRNTSIVLHQATILFHPACVLMGWMTQEARDNWVNVIGGIVADLLGRPHRQFTSDEANSIIRIRSTIPQLPRLPAGNMMFGDWLNAYGNSVPLDPETYSALLPYVNGDERSANMHWGTVNSAQAAAFNGTLNALGEYTCNKCYTCHTTRLGSGCGRSINGKECKGICRLVKNVSDEYVQALFYALNSGGRNNQCVGGHIGLIGTQCVCSCSGTKVPAGPYIQGFDPYHYPLTSPPPTILAYQTRTSDNAIENTYIGVKALGRHLHPILEQMIDDTSAFHVRQSYPWAFGSMGGFLSLQRFRQSLAQEMIANPNRPIIIDESAYKMRPWDLTRGRES